MQKKILLIDDDPLVLRSLEKVLIRDNYEVLAVSDFEDVMERIKDADIDLVLSDIRMPGKDGVETAAAIQSLLKSSGRKEVPMIFITGYAGEDKRLNAPFYGETLYKPIDVEKLLITIRDYL